MRSTSGKVCREQQAIQSSLALSRAKSGQQSCTARFRVGVETIGKWVSFLRSKVNHCRRSRGWHGLAALEAQIPG